MTTREEIQPWIDDDDPAPDLPDLAPEPPVAGDSVLSALKAQRDEIHADRHLDREVPGWRGFLVLRLGPLSVGQQTALTNRIMQTKAKQLPNANVDELIAAFQCALGRAVAGGDLEIIPGPDGEPAGLKELVDVLDLGRASTAREAMRLVFSLANNPEAAIVAVSNDYREWGSNADEEVDQQFTGES
jgi:hypothetical protein